eukprot:TRINITY_DN62707_c0_g1_i1.p3 TRINITY_DN62707_c0_g1~~TRINITY_DN62707_c0_g1_i1.p3  ORF type:complete len:118 (-),score=21.86 TRINITY_DN62707_c0_g1_i1:301-654(-)
MATMRRGGRLVGCLLAISFVFALLNCVSRSFVGQSLQTKSTLRPVHSDVSLPVDVALRAGQPSGKPGSELGAPSQDEEEEFEPDGAAVSILFFVVCGIAIFTCLNNEMTVGNPVSMD